MIASSRSAKSAFGCLTYIAAEAVFPTAVEIVDKLRGALPGTGLLYKAWLASQESAGKDHLLKIAPASSLNSRAVLKSPRSSFEQELPTS